jgi:hypothetical protein
MRASVRIESFLPGSFADIRSEAPGVQQVMRFSSVVATGSSLPLIGWYAVLLIMVGTGVTVYRMLKGASPPTRPKRRVNGKLVRSR